MDSDAGHNMGDTMGMRGEATQDPQDMQRTGEGSTVWVNGEETPARVPAPLDTLLGALYGDLPLTGVAVACDGVVVPRSQWSSSRVEAGARLEVIRATQGG